VLAYWQPELAVPPAAEPPRPEEPISPRRGSKEQPMSAVPRLVSGPQKWLLPRLRPTKAPSGQEARCAI
jgi:hypothetical protein